MKHVYLLQYGEAEEHGETVTRAFTSLHSARAALIKHLSSFIPDGSLPLRGDAVENSGTIETDEGELSWHIWHQAIEP